MYGKAPLTYATPGGGSDRFGWDILKNYYIANRNGNDKINIPGEIDWYDIGTFTAMLKRTTKEYIDNIDETIKNGGWSVQVNHWITKKEEDKFHSQSYETFVDECDYLAKKAQSNEIWVCSMNEAVLYLQEAEKSTVTVEKTDSGYALTLLCKECKANSRNSDSRTKCKNVCRVCKLQCLTDTNKNGLYAIADTRCSGADANANALEQITNRIDNLCDFGKATADFVGCTANSRRCFAEQALYNLEAFECTNCASNIRDEL
jgi:hypothetical protein